MNENELKTELTVEASINNLEKVTSFVNDKLEENECPVKAQMQIDIAIDEIFSNIARYAYSPEIGMVTIQMEVTKQPPEVCITFIDRGIPYNPLLQTEPDTSLSAEERQLGGLGIFLVRKSMDDVIYQYKEGNNILKLKKLLQ